jgi:allantoin racemase
MRKYNEERMFLEVAKLAVEEDMAEVIVLGCAGMTSLDKYIQKALNVPVLDGVICALIITMGFLKYGVSISKRRRFNPNWE